MSVLPLLGEPPARPAPRGGALAAKGFRPFFLLAGAFAASVLPLWLLALAGVVRPDAYLDATYWHAHEMVFGFTTAVIAGFLLTAASNWSARETLTGPPLLGVAALWLAARIAMVVPGLARGITAGLDLAFLPLIALAVARPIVASRSRRNYGMIALLLALWAADVTVHLDVLGLLPGWRRRGVLLGVDLVVLLIVVMAGRIFPMFTRNATGSATIRSHPWLDAAAIAAMVALTVMDAFAPGASLTAIACALAALFTAARAAHWGTRHVWREPLLWILHLGYAWVPLGLALRLAARHAQAIPEPLSTHALTVGAMGSLTLGMMARVALGHTGRTLAVKSAITLAFVLVTLSALVRVVLPLVDVRAYRAGLHASGGLWTLAFTLFVLVYAPILTRPRIDGKPG